MIDTAARMMVGRRPGLRTNLFVLVMLCFGTGQPKLASAGELARPFAMPPFTQTAGEAWLNSEPLSVDSQRGKVILLHFWTFDCWNCYRSFPWLKSVEERFSAPEFQIIGIHSPEFPHEKEASSVAVKVEAFGLRHPVMLDNDFAYWRAMNNRYWPSYYLVDRSGLVRQSFVGETHAGTSRAKVIEAGIMQLLVE